MIEYLKVVARRFPLNAANAIYSLRPLESLQRVGKPIDGFADGLGAGDIRMIT